jgi:uncharacterized membrane protein YedE/YeeE
VNPASWAWVVLAAVIVVGVTAFDVWAHFAGQVSMSAQLRTWLSGELTGPLVVGLWMGLFFGLLWHWIVRIKGP